MNTYPFPSWRRVTFVALLIIVLVVALAPSITQGTVSVRVYGLVDSGVVSHVFVKFSQVQLHTAGYPSNSGWLTLSQTLPRVDLVPKPGQLVPETITSLQVQSGRYDSIKLLIQNATIVVNNGPGIPISSGPSLAANVTLPVPPNRSGEVLFVVTLDYSLLVADPPSLVISILQTTAL